MIELQTEYEQYEIEITKKINRFINGVVKINPNLISPPTFPMRPFHRFHFIKYAEIFQPGSQISKYDFDYEKNIVQEWKKMSKLQKIQRFQIPYLKKLAQRDHILQRYYLIIYDTIDKQLICWINLCKQYQRTQFNIHPKSLIKLIKTKYQQILINNQYPPCEKIVAQQLSIQKIEQYKKLKQQYEKSIKKEEEFLLTNLVKPLESRIGIQLIQYYQLELLGLHYQYYFNLSQQRTQLKYFQTTYEQLLQLKKFRQQLLLKNTKQLEQQLKNHVKRKKITKKNYDRNIIQPPPDQSLQQLKLFKKLKMENVYNCYIKEREEYKKKLNDCKLKKMKKNHKKNKKRSTS